MGSRPGTAAVMSPDKVKEMSHPGRVAGDGDYVWKVKDNQPKLRQDIEALLAPKVCAPGFSPTHKDLETAETCEKEHGRIEWRT